MLWWRCGSHYKLDDFSVLVSQRGLYLEMSRLLNITRIATLVDLNGNLVSVIWVEERWSNDALFFPNGKPHTCWWWNSFTWSGGPSQNTNPDTNNGRLDQRRLHIDPTEWVTLISNLHQSVGLCNLDLRRNMVGFTKLVFPPLVI